MIHCFYSLYLLSIHTAEKGQWNFLFVFCVWTFLYYLLFCFVVFVRSHSFLHFSSKWQIQKEVKGTEIACMHARTSITKQDSKMEKRLRRTILEKCCGEMMPNKFMLEIVFDDWPTNLRGVPKQEMIASTRHPLCGLVGC